MKILLTGFDPFGGETLNPAWEAVKEVRGQGEVELICQQIPTSFRRSGEVLCLLLEKYQPDAVICVGQAQGTTALALERIAINMQDAGIPDNDDHQPQDQKIEENGPDAYFSTLPLRKILEAMLGEEIPTTISNSAGTFVCNHLMYKALHWSKTQGKNMLAGFIHVPCLPKQVLNKQQMPSMAKNDVIRGLEIAIKIVQEVRETRGLPL